MISSSASEKAETTSDSLISLAIPRPLQGLFTYRISKELAARAQIGSRVKVPFGRAVTHAFVVEPPRPIPSTDEPILNGLRPKDLKSVLEVTDSSFTPDVFELCKWAHDYYFSPLGEVLNGADSSLESGKGKKVKRGAKPMKPPEGPLLRHPLTEDQELAFQTLENLRSTKPGSVALLQGVTGSGKTEVYIEVARKALAEEKGVLILVPEIALTPQLHQRFERSLGTAVGLWHSAISAGKRLDQTTALRSGDLKVIVGARSAIFAPFKNLGLIVVDEEHDPTYKQMDRVRYHARDLAIVRGKLTRSLVVLGSATPSLETLERVREGRYSKATLSRRISSAGEPSIDLVDLKTEPLVENIQAALATRTVEAMRETLAAGNQAMIYLNRRGFAAFLLCKDCGEVKGCPQCSISLTLHKQKRLLKCHICGHQEPIPDSCTKCQGLELFGMGAGTESLELELPQLLPEAKILRLDRDQITSATRLEEVLDDFREGKGNILLGTQMLVKGHDFPRVTLVVVILADGLFRWPDFRAPERAFQILKQVSGRAGRGERAGKVLIQTYDPSHAVLQVIKGESPEAAFLENERDLRLALGYPPFGRIARLRFENSNQNDARSRAEAVARVLNQVLKLGEVDVLGPSEAFLERVKGIYRWDILLKSKKVNLLQSALIRCRDLCAENKWPFIADVDPYGI